MFVLTTFFTLILPFVHMYNIEKKQINVLWSGKNYDFSSPSIRITVKKSIKNKTCFDYKLILS